MEKNISVMNDLHKINISNVLNPSPPMESNLVQNIPPTPPPPAVSRQLSEAMQRRVADFLERGGKLRSGGGFLLPEELPLYGSEPYRRTPEK